MHEDRILGLDLELGVGASDFEAGPMAFTDLPAEGTIEFRNLLSRQGSVQAPEHIRSGEELVHVSRMDSLMTCRAAFQPT